MLSKLILVLFAVEMTRAGIPVWFNQQLDAATGCVPNVIYVLESTPEGSIVDKLWPYCACPGASFKLESTSRSGLFRVDSSGSVIVNASLDSEIQSREILVVSSRDDTGAEGLVVLLIHILQELPHAPAQESQELEIPNATHMPEEQLNQTVHECPPEFSSPLRVPYNTQIGYTVFTLDDSKADEYSLNGGSLKQVDRKAECA